MDEKPVATARASVMMFDSNSNSWIASGSTQGISKVQLFKHQINNTYRVVGWKLTDKEVVLNCAIFRGLKYNQARPTFHQWRDTKHQVYGLNFTSKDEAETFATAIMEALENLNQIYRQSQQLIAQQQQEQMDFQSQQYQYSNLPQSQIQQYQPPQPPSIYQSQISGNSSMPEYAMPQKQMQQMNIGTVNNVTVDNYQSYAPPMSSNGSTSGISNDFKGAIIEEVPIVILPTVSAPPPPPPPGPPPPSSAPPPPPGPPPLSNITLGKSPQNDSDDDSQQSGLASQLRQARLKSRNANSSEIELVSSNQNKNIVTSSATLGRNSVSNVAVSTPAAVAGGGDMMSEMQRVLAARKKAKEVPKVETSDNCGSGDNSSKTGLRQNHHRSQSDCDREPLNGAPNNQPKTSTDASKATNLQCATLGRKGSLQPESQQGSVTRQDLDIFKREILQEVRTMIQQFKVDIVDAIRTNRP